jgi:hypothetical protein
MSLDRQACSPGGYSADPDYFVFDFSSSFFGHELAQNCGFSRES